MTDEAMQEGTEPAVVEKVEINYIHHENPHLDRGPEGFVTANVTDPNVPKTKHEVHMPTATNEEEAKKFYNSNMAAIFNASIRQLLTRPDWKQCLLDDPTGDSLQALADSYEIGKVSARAGTSKKAGQFDEVTLMVAEILEIDPSEVGMAEIKLALNKD